MTDADKLAQVLAEHYAMGVSAEGVVECTCGDGFVYFEIDHDPTPEHCAHVAAVVLAHLKESGVMSVWRFQYPTGRAVERTTISWERDIA